MLHGYHSFTMAFQVGKNAGGDDEVDQAKATKEVKSWVKLNPQTITQKAALIVEAFPRQRRRAPRRSRQGDGRHRQPARPRSATSSRSTNTSPKGLRLRHIGLRSPAPC